MGKGSMLSCLHKVRENEGGQGGYKRGTASCPISLLVCDDTINCVDFLFGVIIEYTSLLGMEKRVPITKVLAL